MPTRAPRRKIKKGEITHISLVPRGKNRLGTILKEDGAVELNAPMVKMDEEGNLLAVVYVPGAPDTDGDFADAAVIKEMAYGFMRDHRNVDIRHDLNALSKERAFIAESFIIAKGDERFRDFKDLDGNTIDPTGGWAVSIHLADEELRKQYRNGGWNGVSMYGRASLETVSKGETDEIVFNRLAELLGISKQEEESDMKPEELSAALAANNAVLAKSIVDGLTASAEAKAKTDADAAAKAKAEADAATAKAKAERPSFKGDPTDPKAVEAFAKELRGFELRERLANAKTADEVAAIQKELAGTTKNDEPTDAEAGVVATDSPEVITLKKQLATALRKSSQAAGDVKPETTEDGISKELLEFEKGVAADINARFGVIATATK